MIPSPRDIHDLLVAHGVRPSKGLGQNFVADANTVRRIARLADVNAASNVLEIGAGLGSLTVALAETGASVVALEVDRRLVRALRDRVEPMGVRVVEADALTVDFESLLGADGPGRPWTVVANLPYNVAVPLVVRVLDEAPSVTRMLVMVQREVGMRLAAPPGGPDYGAVSVKVAYHARARVVGQVSAAVFVPRPKVESVLVSIERRDAVAVDPAVVPAEQLFTVVRAGFAHRRKMLRRSLHGVVSAQAFVHSGVDPTARAETLSVEDWGRLAACAPGQAE